MLRVGNTPRPSPSGTTRPRPPTTYETAASARRRRPSSCLATPPLDPPRDRTPPDVGYPRAPRAGARPVGAGAGAGGGSRGGEGDPTPRGTTPGHRDRKARLPGSGCFTTALLACKITFRTAVPLRRPRPDPFPAASPATRASTSHPLQSTVPSGHSHFSHSPLPPAGRGGERREVETVNRGRERAERKEGGREGGGTVSTSWTGLR